MHLISNRIFENYRGFIRGRRRINTDMQRLWSEEKYKLFTCKEGRHGNKVLGRLPCSCLHFLLWKGTSDACRPVLSMHPPLAMLLPFSILCCHVRGTLLSLSQHRDTIYFVVSLFPLDFLSCTQSHMLFRTSPQLLVHSAEWMSFSCCVKLVIQTHKTYNSEANSNHLRK